MPQLGILHIVAQGDERFRVLSHRSQADGLLIGEVETIAKDEARSIAPEFSACVDVLRQIIAGVGEQRFNLPLQFDDDTWVSNRLAEVLPLPLPTKQQLLELSDGNTRLAALKEILLTQGLLS